EVRPAPEKPGDEISRRIPPAADVVRAEEDVGRELLRLQQNMEHVRHPEGTLTREHKAPPHRDRGGASAVEVRKKIEVPVAVIEVERVPSHIKPEQRKTQGVGPERITPPAATHE